METPAISVKERSLPTEVGQGNRASTVRHPRIVLYSHDTLGFGHLRRNLLLADALRRSASRAEILLIAGMREAGAFEIPAGVDCLTLPAYSKGSDGQYQPRDLGSNLGELTELRASIIKAAIMSFEPELLIVDNVPRGAQSELNSTLQHLRGSNPRTSVVLGLRDVIDSPSTVRKQWLRQRNFEAIRDFYDEVWVYGDPGIYDLIDDCQFGEDIRRKASHTGFLDQSARLNNPAAWHCRDSILGDDCRPYVLCAVGGGKDGGALCEAFSAASLPAGYRGILITGSQMAKDRRYSIQKMVDANPDLTLVDFIREPIALMQGAAGIVSMGGYNTVCEVLSLGRPALIVPRVAPRQEQWLRAGLLQAHSLVDLLHPERLDAESLSRWMTSLHGKPNTIARSIVDLNGLDRVTALAERFLSDLVAPLSEAG
ncbi:glycosyltransferase family protein [Granulosicoccus sp. 3-233]|uniref:glycosyltransferase family protein n=1 Tax=Granulosicoccus sp. 3-233 TaxID=3417969 RepID=UPI003D351675